MEVDANDTSVNETRSAVGFVLNMSSDEVVGYMVIALKPDGTLTWTSNSANYAQVVAMMATLILDIADSTPLAVIIPMSPP